MSKTIGHVTATHIAPFVGQAFEAIVEKVSAKFGTAESVLALVEGITPERAQVVANHIKAWRTTKAAAEAMWATDGAVARQAARDITAYEVALDAAGIPALRAEADQIDGAGAQAGEAA
jgi:hypothetical protein